VTLHVEGVLHLPRRVVGGHVQGGEVVPVVLDLRPFGPDEAHLAEDIDDFVDGLGNGVEAPTAHGARGLGDVDGFGGEAGVELGVGETGLARVQRPGDLVLERVQRLTRGLAGLRVEAAELLHLRGDFPLLSEGGNADFLEGCYVACGVDAFQQSRLQRV